MNANQSVVSNENAAPNHIQLSNGKSAFTPFIQKPVPQRLSPINLFEPSPIQKFLYFTALAQQHQEAASKVLNKVLTPNKQVTPSNFLRIGAFNDMMTPKMLKSESFQQQQQQYLGNGPRGFSYDVIIPQKSMLNSSPLDEGMNTDGSADLDKDMESTDYSSQEKQDQLEKAGHRESEKSKKRRPLEINGIIIDNFLASDDLNECVDFLLRKDKGDLTLKNEHQKVIRHNAFGKSKDKKKRQRKNLDQHSILSEYFDRNPNWDKQTIQKLSDILGLKESQIYKWNWDQRKKFNMED